MERISIHQFNVLGSAVLLGTTFFPVGFVATVAAGRDGWMSVFPGFIIGIPLGLYLLSLMSQYPKKNLIEISEILLGKWIGKFFAILYIGVTAYFGATLAGQGVDMFTRSILPNVPRIVFLIGGFLIVFLLSWVGVEVYARFAEVIFPVVVVGLVLTAIFIVPRFEQGELYPILGNGGLPVLKGSLEIVPWTLEYILFLAWLLPFLPQKKEEVKKLKKGVWITVILVSLINTMVVLIELLTFGPVERVRFNYGLLVLGKMIEVSRTLAGVESLFAMIWMGALAIKVAAFFYAARIGLKTVFGFKELWLNLFIGAFFFFIPYRMVRGSSIIVEIVLVDKYMVLPFTMGWILLIWGADKWKNKAKVSNQGDGS